MSAEMVERARLAFADALKETPAWNVVKKCDVADFRVAMRAATAALREPTAAMVRAGENAMPFAGPTVQMWRAMIDEPLK